ncbi:hypothetical protein RhiirA1_485218, partial [Rhizophagus irregularis]
MANANTPGYKADQSTIRSFPDMLISAIGNTNIPTEKNLNFQNAQEIGGLNTGVYLQETLANYGQGSLMQTNLTTDVALIDGTLPIDEESGNQGAIFFRLEHPNGGEAYTRNGNFTLDGQGYLVNGNGYYVLSNEGERIYLPNDDFQVAEDGTITFADVNVAQIG